MVAAYGESAEIEEVLGCGGLQSSISNIITFEIDLIWPQLAALKRMLRLGERAGKVPRRPFIDMLREHNERTGFFERADLDRSGKAARRP
jgi:hypothetical protein